VDAAAHENQRGKQTSFPQPHLCVITTITNTLMRIIHHLQIEIHNSLDHPILSIHSLHIIGIHKDHKMGDGLMRVVITDLIMGVRRLMGGRPA